MKLPFAFILSYVLKPHYTQSNFYCRLNTFSYRRPYTYLFATLGLLMNVHVLRTHLGKAPHNHNRDCVNLNQNTMLLHDFKIIASSMTLVQYVCLLVGCMTDNPALFLPHLLCQFIAIMVKMYKAAILLCPFEVKSLPKLGAISFSVLLMSFNWMQEFCVFNEQLFLCDL